MNFSSSPADEECAQVGRDGYAERARLECQVYIAQLKRAYNSFHGEAIPESLTLRIKSNLHDYGTYLEVAASFDDNDEKAVAAAFWLDEHCPLTWDAEAKTELGL